MLTALWYRDRKLRPDVPLAELRALLADPSGLLWLDVEGPDEDALAVLERLFGFHPLALEDVRTGDQRPKVDRYGDRYEFVVLYGVTLEPGRFELVFTQVGIFIGPSYLVTTHCGPVEAAAELAGRWRRHPAMMEPHPLGMLLHALVDGLVDGYFPVADALQQRMDSLEEILFASATPAVLHQLLHLRRELIKLRRYIGEERDVLNVFLRADHPVFHQATAAYFNDVYDHLLRLSETLDMQRDILGEMMDAYLSQQSNRLNEVVKRLTGLTLVLMVVTLVTGFFGMNVHFPGKDEPLGLAIAAASMALLGAAALVVARRQGWL